MASIGVMLRHAFGAGLPLIAGGDWQVEPEQLLATLSVRTISSHKSAPTIVSFLVTRLRRVVGAPAVLVVILCPPHRAVRLVTTARSREQMVQVFRQQPKMPGPKARPWLGTAPSRPLIVSFKTQWSSSFEKDVCHQAEPTKVALQDLSNTFDEWVGTVGEELLSTTELKVHGQGSPRLPLGDEGRQARPVTLQFQAVQVGRDSGQGAQERALALG